MSFLKNASIRTKVLSLVLPLCAVGMSATLYMSYNYKRADNTYSTFISKDTTGATAMARANRNLTATAYAAYQILVYDRDSAGMQKAIAFYNESKTKIFDRLAAARDWLLPQRPGHEPAQAAVLPGARRIADRLAVPVEPSIRLALVPS